MDDVSVVLNNVSKRYVKEWILKNVSLSFSNSYSYAIIGPNGSGKTTLIEIISSFLSPTNGTISYYLNGNSIPAEKVFRYVSVCTPALSLVEEMNLKQALDFHFGFKRVLSGHSKNSIMDKLSFDPELLIRNYSSGMKQRLKLALSFYSESSILILDEPTTNLDSAGFDWFLQLVSDLKKDRLLVLSSNLDREISICDRQISILNYKVSNSAVN